MSDIEGNDVFTEEEGSKGECSAVADDVVEGGAPLCVYAHHEGCGEVDEAEDKKGTEADGLYIPKGFVRVLDAHHEVEYGGYAGKEYAARKPFAVHHEEETEIDECSARLTLPDDERHGEEYEGRDEEEVTQAVHAEVAGTHKLGYAECSAELGELSRL